MPEKQLLALLQELRDISKGTEAELAAELMHDDRHKRCYAITSRRCVFCQKGGMTQKDHSISGMKSTGANKKKS